MSDAQILAIVGAVAAILGAIEIYRTKGEGIAAWGVALLGIGLVLVFLT